MLLLCTFDAYSYLNSDLNRAAYLRLRECRLDQLRKRRAAQQANEQAPVRVRSHTASFTDDDRAYLFTKVTNERKEGAITLANYDVEHAKKFSYSNDQRPLPTRLEAGEIFETWVPLEDLEDLRSIEERVRIGTTDGTVARGEVNKCVPPFGVVGGPGRVIDKVAVREEGLLSPDSQSGRTWDVFVSHAAEDLDSVALPLQAKLIELGLTVWLDAAAFTIGDNQRRRIDEGILASRFAVTILSPRYLSKGWTNWELDGIVVQDVSGKQQLLPIWHNLNADQVRTYSPSLANRFARRTTEESIDEIAAEIAATVRASRR